MVPAGSRLQMDGDTSEPSLSLYNAFTRHKPNIGMKILIPTLNMFQIQWKTCNCQFLQIFSVPYVHAVNSDTGECFQLQKRNLWKLWPFRHLLWVMRKHYLTNKKTTTKTKTMTNTFKDLRPFSHWWYLTFLTIENLKILQS